MRVLVPLPIALPLFGAALALLLRRRLVLQRALAVLVLGAVLGICIALLVTVDREGTVAVQIGDWPAPFGITLAVDMFSALMLVVSAATLLAVHVYAIGQGGSDELSPYFHPVYLALAAGVSASFLAGDLFYLFVSFEVLLAASYVLITLGGRAAQVRTGMTYVVLNLLGSMLFLASVGLVYASVGSVNLADLVDRFDTIPVGLKTALGLMLLVAFGIKAAVFPLFSWLPDSYPTAPAPVTAVFAGLLTKVGVYAIIRTQTFYFGDGSPSVLLAVIAGLTMVVGVLGAIAQNDVKRILSFHIVSQIGYMIMGLAFFTVAGIAGAIFFIVHQIPVKTGLFLVSGIVERSSGTASLKRLSGLARTMPFTAAMFFLTALSLAGIPPFSGFVAKLSLVEAGFGIDQFAIVGVSLVVSLLTLFSMTKIWNGAFWGPVPTTGRPGRPAPAMVGATAFLVAMSLLIAFGGRAVYDMSERASQALLDPSEYVDRGVAMTRRLVLVGWLAFVWVALWGDVTVANVTAGLALAVGLVLAFRFPLPPTPSSTVRVLSAAWFLAFFSWKLVEASAIVAWEVVTPRNRINEGIIAVPIHGSSDAVATIVANFITLTPGTLTLEFERAPSVLYIHVLHLRSIEAVRRDVQHLERIAVAAFGSAEARRDLLAEQAGGEVGRGGRS